ncbi:putative mitochondrial aconitate hydratase [Moniliophthora roreri MCA 2997]|uniref:Large ribosomal subunit protein mL40 n=2 Tax=Moniliophthora roreri TaxID=221103 RepID=V2XUK9_MONRO|nr:putative mitochondrial aconitate hydratase [Moniliophthora roreri MCA 2997]KAI3621889.1 putative mitochondrial aconitate hydratase [Moniliophthora roreri]
MSFSPLTFNLRRQTTLRVAQSSIRTYARKGEGPSDPQKEAIRRALYPGNIRNRPTPTGTWRPDVGTTIQRAIPSKQAHDTIERAWLLHKRHVRKRREAELVRKFDCVKSAMDELAKIDGHLYYEANRTVDPRARSPEEQKIMRSMKSPVARAFDARIRGLFPRELRIPTDTPSKTGWNYEYKPVQRPV